MRARTRRARGVCATPPLLRTRTWLGHARARRPKAEFGSISRRSRVERRALLVARLLIGSNESQSPGRHGAWCLEMAYDKSRAELGPGQMLLLTAVGEALGRGDRFLNFLQNFAYYKHRWGAELIDVANVQLIR